MKPCGMDLQFWTARNAPTWARTMLKQPPDAVAALHWAISFRGDKTRAAELERHRRPGRFLRQRDVDTRRNILEKGNAVAVLKMVRRRGASLPDYMASAAREYKELQPKRANTYTRWLRRMGAP